MGPELEPVASDAALPQAADVAIIGGGIVGIATAWFLAQRGLRVAVVEKGRIGGEQSSRNWGWCRQQGRDFGEVPLSQHSLRLWESLQAETGRDLGFRRTGVLFVGNDPAQIADWEAWAHRARDHQLGTRLLGAAETMARLPGCAETFRAGLYTESDGIAEPSRAAPALAEAARGLGVTLHQDCAAWALETTGGRVSALVTEKGRIRAGAVLCAAGAWSSLFCRRHGIALPQAGVYATAFRTGPAPEITAGGTSLPGFAVRRRADGGYTVGLAGRGRVRLSWQGLRYARAFWPTFRKRRKNITLGLETALRRGPEGIATWPDSGPTPFERDRVLDPAADPALVESALGQLRAMFPAFRDVTVTRSWGGLIDSTPDAVPVISAVDSLPGFFISTGYSGHGFGIAPGAGRLGADLIAGAAPIVDPTPFRYARMIDGRRLRPAGSF
jgi:glycine/D-amino acid oxidase-like deaminating enzyme